MGGIRCGIQIYLKAGEEVIENAEYIRQLMHLLRLRGGSTRALRYTYCVVLVGSISFPAPRI